MFLQAGHVRNKNVSASDAPNFYSACQAIDGFDGPHDGTTVRAAMKVLQAQGYVTEYRWAWTVRDCANWILAQGPCCFGTDWLESMFQTAKFNGSQFIEFDSASPVAGGHAFLVFGVDLQKKCPDHTVGAFEMQNSWGLGWGAGGRAWLSFTAAAALLAESGEVAMPMEIVKRAA